MQPWVLYALGSAVFAALVAILGKMGLAGVDSTLATTVRAIIMAGFLIITSIALGKFAFTSQLTNKAILFIVLSGIAGALSWLCYFAALKTGPPSGVSAIDRTSVVLVFVLATLFLAEAFSWKHALGALLVAGGAALMI